MHFLSSLKVIKLKNIKFLEQTFKVVKLLKREPSKTFKDGGLQVSLQSRPSRKRRSREDLSRQEVHPRDVPAGPGCHDRGRLYDQNGRN